METLEGLVIINGTDIWKEYGVFLTEEKKGGRENLTAIMMPAKAKTHVGVNIREHDGVKYSADLNPKSEERDVTLHFALFAPTKEQWLSRYRAFISFLKQGEKGWLRVRLSELDLTMTMFYVDSSNFKPLTYLWKEGVQASRFKVKFREPEPSF
ncbi:hypothetical protein [Muribaculum intestinale]|uniref:hypothetical protein n=1 Tax=Muribaculum intestinale TaxID=1796646 RepID=UPI0025B5C49A|nr:hypothetical protein [Muribaculum intestinale]